MVPRSLVQPSGALAANAVTALNDRATTRRAVNASIMVMRFIFCVSFSYPPNGVHLKRCQVGCEFAGAGRVVCASTSSYKQASCPLPVHEYFVSPNLGSSLPSPSRSPFSQKTKPATLDPLVLCVAGCTTGSLCPWYPYLRDKVLSLYLKARALSFLAKKHNKAKGQSLCFCAPKPCQNALNTDFLRIYPLYVPPYSGLV